MRWQFNYDGCQFDIEARDWEEIKDKILDCLTPIEEEKKIKLRIILEYTTVFKNMENARQHEIDTTDLDVLFDWIDDDVIFKPLKNDLIIGKVRYVEE